MLDLIKYGTIAAIGVFIVYCSFLFVVPQYKYYSFKSDAADIVNFHMRRTEDIKVKLLKRARELDVPVKPENIIVELHEKRFYARIGWSETVDIVGKYQKTYNFDVVVGGKDGKGDDIGGGLGRGRKVFL